MAKCILAGYRYVDYVSNKTSKPVQGVNLFLVGPQAAPSPGDKQAMHGSEVFREYVRPDQVQGVQLVVGQAYDIEYGRGFNGQAAIVAISPLIDAPSAVDRMVASAAGK